MMPLEYAANLAAMLARELRVANIDAGAVESMLLLPMIERAALLNSDIRALIEAKEAGK